MTPYYEAGGVTIYHGDCLEVLPHLSGVGAVVTDPPYSSGGAFRGDRTASTILKYSKVDARQDFVFSGDNKDQLGHLVWSTLWLIAARRACVPSASLCAFTDWRQMAAQSHAIQSAGWVLRGCSVWHKPNGRPQKGQFGCGAEFVQHGTNGPAVDSGRYPEAVFRCPAVPSRHRGHLAQKPAPVISWLLQVTRPGCLILDPFAGSGVVLATAREAGHTAIGIEVDERHCETAAKMVQRSVDQIGLFGDGAGGR